MSVFSYPDTAEERRPEGCTMSCSFGLSDVPSSGRLEVGRTGFRLSFFYQEYQRSDVLSGRHLTGMLTLIC